MTASARLEPVISMRRSQRGVLVRLFLLRLRFVLVQLFGVLTLTFVLVRLLPGDPAAVLAGPNANAATISEMRRSLGLDQPIPVQFILYLQHVVRGDLGTSIVTGHPVTEDLGLRLPATLELITYALICSLAVGLGLGLVLARRRARLLNRGVFAYAMLAGAIPDFWLALLLVLIFAFVLRVAPPPLGRLGFAIAPQHVTGFYTVDALLRGDLRTMLDAAWHLMLPVLTLVLVNAGQFVKITRNATTDADRAPFVDLYAGAGVDPAISRRRSFRLALPPVVTLAGVVYGFLLGGAVLVEQVYSWGGVGQYAVEAFQHADYAAIQGFVLLAASFNIMVYLVVDLIFVALDPRLGRRR